LLVDADETHRLEPAELFNALEGIAAKWTVKWTVFDALAARAFGTTAVPASRVAGPAGRGGGCRKEIGGFNDAPEGETGMPHKMTCEEIRAFLSHGTRTAKVATSGPDGQPHVMPVWFVLDGEELVFMTWGDSVKGRNLRRNPRAAIVVDEEVAPYAFAHIRGHVTLSEDPEELLRFATAIGGRYMGADRAEEFGRRNAVPGELLVRLRPERVIATADVAS
jgi:PPOX class probable F420-dependent enzyme